MQRFRAQLPALALFVLMGGISNAQSDPAPSVAATMVESSPYLATRDPIRTELKLNPKQLEGLRKLEDRFSKELAALVAADPTNYPRLAKAVIGRWSAQQDSLLKPEQRKKLRQAHLRGLGYQIFNDRSIQKELKLSEAQNAAIRTKIKRYFDELNRQTQESFKAVAQNGDAATRKRLSDEFNALEERNRRSILSVLTDEQRKQLVELIGESFPQGPRYEFPDPNTNPKVLPPPPVVVPAEPQV